jgi:hypothetical protein
MNYEIYTDKNGTMRVNIGAESFALKFEDGRHLTAGAEWERTSDPVTQAYYSACDELGVPKRCSWTGVMNALGHVGNVRPPWKPRPKDWNR